MRRANKHHRRLPLRLTLQQPDCRAALCSGDHFCHLEELYEVQGHSLSRTGQGGWPDHAGGDGLQYAPLGDTIGLIGSRPAPKIGETPQNPAKPTAARRVQPRQSIQSQTKPPISLPQRGRWRQRLKIFLQPSHFQAPRPQRGNRLGSGGGAGQRCVIGHFLHQRGAAE